MNPQSGPGRAGFSALFVKERKHLAVTIVNCMLGSLISALSLLDRPGQPVPQVTAGHRQRGADGFCHGTHLMTLDVANVAALKKEKQKCSCGHKATVSNPASWSRKTKTQAFGKAGITTALQTL